MNIIMKPIEKMMAFNKEKVEMHQHRIDFYERLMTKYENQKKIYDEVGLKKEACIFSDKIDKVEYELSLEYKQIKEINKKVKLLYKITSKIS